MKRIALMAMLLLSPGWMLAAPADGPSTSGLWKVDGDVQGTAVKMTCTLTETEHKLTGACAGAADNYTPHQVAGKVKDRTLELHFQTYVQGNPITLSLSGTLNDDSSKLNGDLDVEPMGVGGTFAAQRDMAGAPTPAAPAAAATPAPATAAAAVAGETWKVTGDVQGTPVLMTCAIAMADSKLGGTCTGAAGDMSPKKLTGEATDKGWSWQFDTVYDGNPITVAMRGTKSPNGASMNGFISVAPMGVDGTFSAVKQ